MEMLSIAPQCEEMTDLAAHEGEAIRLHGSIHKIRRMSGFAFILLRTRRETIQCVLEEAAGGIAISELREEMCVRILARVVPEPRARQGLELHVERIEVLSAPAEPLPVAVNTNKAAPSLETLLDLRPVTLRSERERAIFRVQAALCEGFRRFLTQASFVEVHTPKLVSEGVEGGANLFSLAYFGRQAYLSQSPQAYKQMLVGAFERVFEIGPVFRAEKHDTSRHLNEYTGVDFEMGYIEGFEDVMRMEVGMIKSALACVKETCAPEIALLGAHLPCADAIPSLTFDEAKAWLAKKEGYAPGEAMDLDPEEERALCEIVRQKTGAEFVFVTRYPSEKRPFYVLDDPMRPKQTLSFDLLFRGLEVTTGGQRIHDYTQQVEKMKRRGLNPDAFSDYLLMHKAGMPPHGGMGLGLERFTAQLLGLGNVRRATLFPRDTHRLRP